jgi:hypothetical protein
VFHNLKVLEQKREPGSLKQLATVKATPKTFQKKMRNPNISCPFLTFHQGPGEFSSPLVPDPPNQRSPQPHPGQLFQKVKFQGPTLKKFSSFLKMIILK